MTSSPQEFLKKAFRAYYFKNVESVEVPEEVEKREFGLLNFDNAMVRHLTCANAGEVKALLVKESPRSAYCSVAYYESPGAPMEEKGLIKADLAFDIDSDDLHLPCAAKHDFVICESCHTPTKDDVDRCPSCASTKLTSIHWVCNDCIAAAREEVLKLQDFLERDFGVLTSQIRTYFSGNRGFHLSVVGSKYEVLDQRGRTELVEYLSGKGLSIKQLGLSKRRPLNEQYYKLPTADEPGWRGRVAAAFQSSTSVNSRDAIAKAFSEQPDGFEALLAKTVDKLGVKVDAGVTTDTHRVFRMGMTLHDKSGLIKKRYQNVIHTDPFVDAVAFGSDPVKVSIDYAPEFSLMGLAFGPYRRQVCDLPTYAAVYLMAKDMAVPV